MPTRTYAIINVIIFDVIAPSPSASCSKSEYNRETMSLDIGEDSLAHLGVAVSSDLATCDSQIA